MGCQHNEDVFLVLGRSLEVMGSRRGVSERLGAKNEDCYDADLQNILILEIEFIMTFTFLSLIKI